MRPLALSAFILAFSIVASPVLAESGGPPPRPSSPQPRDEVKLEPSPREKAELHYANAYEEVKKGAKDLEKDKTKKAKKRFEKALDLTEKAVELDDQYFEAWNLMGYSLRKLGDFEGSLVAYGKCLKINPRYVAARDYLGEALVELGKIDEAREQLAWLTKLEAEKEAGALEKKIAAWVAAHADAEATKGEAAPAKGGTEGNE